MPPHLFWARMGVQPRVDPELNWPETDFTKQHRVINAKLVPEHAIMAQAWPIDSALPNCPWWHYGVRRKKTVTLRKSPIHEKTKKAAATECGWIHL